MNRRRQGFTLIEVMMVVAIMMMVAGISIPRLMRSYQGAQIRASTRMLAMSHRYARSLAVLNQQDFALVVSPLRNDIAILSLPPLRSTYDEAREEYLGDRGAGFVEGAIQSREDAAVAEAAAKTAEGMEVRLEEKLEERVGIEDIEVREDQKDRDGNAWILYYANGTCDAYRIVLVDRDGRSATVQSDSMSGQVRVEFDR